jgi:hypothetical protein
MQANRYFLKAGAAAVLTFAAGMAAAADTSTLAVSASIVGTCKFAAASYPMAFAAITPGVTTGAATKVAAVTYNCTNGTVVTSVGPTAGGLSRQMTHTDTTTKLSYTLSVGAAPDGAGFGSGTQKSVDITGSIAQADYDVAKAGSYSENVGLTIAP